MTDFTYRKLLKQLRIARRIREKKGNWSREVGAGFIKEDIKQIIPFDNKKLVYRFNLGGSQTLETPDLNMRELDESIKFAEKRALKEKIRYLKQ